MVTDRPAEPMRRGRNGARGRRQDSKMEMLTRANLGVAMSAGRTISYSLLQGSQSARFAITFDTQNNIEETKTHSSASPIGVLTTCVAGQ